MFDLEELPKKKDAPEPRKLDTLGIDELQEYIAWLQGEIARVEEDIKRKQSAGAKAASFFKP